MLKPTKFLIVFVIGIAAGIIIEYAIDYPYGLDCKKNIPGEYVAGIMSLISGNMVFFMFLILSMFVSIILTVIPYLKSKYPDLKLGSRINETSTIPLIRGVTVGFGIMIIYHLYTKGLPKLFSQC